MTTRKHEFDEALESLERDSMEELRMSKPKKKVVKKKVQRRISYEREAEELRAGIERLIEVDSGKALDFVAYDPNQEVVTVDALQQLLDRVDARDSLKFLVDKNKRKRRKAKR